MKTQRLSIALLLLFGLAAGCATTKVTNREQLVNEKLPRPGQILVYDFVANAADVPSDSSLSGQVDAQKQTKEQIQLGRQVGATIATELANEIRAMGLPALHAKADSKPKVNDIVIRGYLVSIDEGSTLKRVTIGFGSGSAELKTTVEGYQVTEYGMRKLGSSTLDASGNKAPGAVAPAAVLIATGNPIGLIVSSGVKAYGEISGKNKIEGRAKQTAQEIADQLKPRFQQQGWIQ